MKKSILLLTVMLMCLITSAQQVNGLIVSEDEQFKIVKVWGTHEERGYAAGYLLAPGIADLFENYLMPAFGSYYNMGRTLMQTQAHISIDSVYIYEAMAMADGINDRDVVDFEVDYIDVLLANSFLDLQNFLGKGLGLDNGCSSLMSWGSATAGTELDGKSAITRHLDWNDQPVIIRNQVMVIHFPSEPDEQNWALIGFAGQISVLSGFNQSGLAVMQHMLSDVYAGAELNKAYEPVWFSLRKAIEMKDYNNDGQNNALDVNDVVQANIFGYADSYIITALAPSTCGDDNKIATIIEVAPAIPFISIRNTEYPDLIPDKNLYAANYAISRNDAVHTCTRYNAVRNNMGDGTAIGAHEQWQIMLDYSSSCAFGGGGNIQFMQFVPENNFFKLAYHTSSGTQACENTSVVYSTSDLFDLNSAITRLQKSKKMSVSPNPCNAELTILLPEYIEPLAYTVISSTGKTVFTGIAESETIQLQIGWLQPGLYRLIAGDGKNAVSFVKL